MQSKNKYKYTDEELENFDKEEDIILPDTYFGEFVYILFILWDIAIHRKDIKRNWQLLQRQIGFFWLWKKTQKGFCFYKTLGFYKNNESDCNLDEK